MEFARLNRFNFAGMTENEKSTVVGGAPSAGARRVAVVIPAWNGVDYTRGCLASLKADAAAGAELLLIDNGSVDGTAEFLAALDGVTVITNPANRGCATAWNQGVKAASREWIVLLNNDVVMAAQWLDGMVAFAEESGVDVVTPAIREGPLNYALPAYAKDFVREMKPVQRLGVANGICFMVRRRVFEKTGFFDEKFRIGQFEDEDFFLRAKLAGFKLGTTGRAFLHHFGSVTQNAIRSDAAADPGSYEAENRAYYRKKWGLTASRRLGQRWRQQAAGFWWRSNELLRHGHTLHEKWIGGKVRYY
jgi:N-acetylglucosaminyl-diphospho-decaprenol L-rhamnosyltransferase